MCYLWHSVILCFKSMLIDKIIGNSSEFDIAGYKLDYIQLEWYELNKRIQRKSTTSGVEVAMKFMGENIALKDGDILYCSAETKEAIVVEVLTTKAIVISPTTMQEMATVCYEIGNKHMPLFIDGDDIMLPYEAPMFKWMESAGYNPMEQQRKLCRRLKSNDSSHSHSHSHGDHHHSHGDGHHHHHHHDNIFSKVVNFATKKSSK